jgi:VanZ family protein
LVKQLFRRWLPPILWTGLILYLSGESGSSGVTERWILWFGGELTADTLFYINYSLRKAGHVFGYAILGTLNHRALEGRRELLAVALAGVVAIIDEGHQSTSPLRTAALADIGFDVCGAALGVILSRRSAAKDLPGMTR